MWANLNFDFQMLLDYFVLFDQACVDCVRSGCNWPRQSGHLSAVSQRRG
jgi:hypothetical protein